MKFNSAWMGGPCHCRRLFRNSGRSNHCRVSSSTSGKHGSGGSRALGLSGHHGARITKGRGISNSCGHFRSPKDRFNSFRKTHSTTERDSFSNIGHLSDASTSEGSYSTSAGESSYSTSTSESSYSTSSGESSYSTPTSGSSFSTTSESSLSTSTSESSYSTPSSESDYSTPSSESSYYTSDVSTDSVYGTDDVSTTQEWVDTARRHVSKRLKRSQTSDLSSRSTDCYYSDNSNSSYSKCESSPQNSSGSSPSRSLRNTSYDDKHYSRRLGFKRYSSRRRTGPCKNNTTSTTFSTRRYCPATAAYYTRTGCKGNRLSGY